MDKSLGNVEITSDFIDGKDRIVDIKVIEGPYVPISACFVDGEKQIGDYITVGWLRFRVAEFWAEMDSYIAIQEQSRISLFYRYWAYRLVCRMMEIKQKLKYTKRIWLGD